MKTNLEANYWHVHKFFHISICNEQIARTFHIFLPLPRSLGFAFSFPHLKRQKEINESYYIEILVWLHYCFVSSSSKRFSIFARHPLTTGFDISVKSLRFGFGFEFNLSCLRFRFLCFCVLNGPGQDTFSANSHIEKTTFKCMARS